MRHKALEAFRRADDQVAADMFADALLLYHGEFCSACGWRESEGVGGLKGELYMTKKENLCLSSVEWGQDWKARGLRRVAR